MGKAIDVPWGAANDRIASAGAVGAAGLGHPNAKGQPRLSTLTLDSYGRGEKIRTSDPLHPMQVRYQAALRPDENHQL